MQPTMKLRLFCPENGIPKGVPFITDSYGRCYVLQQLWEGAKIKPEYEHILPGSVIPWDGVTKLTIYEPFGVWRDIPIEVES